MKITVYTKHLTYCAQCVVTKRKLDALGLAYAETAVDVDETAAERLRAVGYLQTPVVEISDESGAVVDAWTGYRPDKLEALA